MHLRSPIGFSSSCSYQAALTCTCVVRIPWHMFKMVPSLLHDDTFILLRWILLFHNTSFILIAIEWTMLLHRASLKSKIDKNKLRLILFIVFGVLVGFIYVHTIVLFGVIDGKREVCSDDERIR